MGRRLPIRRPARRSTARRRRRSANLLRAVRNLRQPQVPSHTNTHLRELVRARLHSPRHRPRRHQHVLLLLQHPVAADDHRVLHERRRGLEVLSRAVAAAGPGDFLRCHVSDCLWKRDPSLALAADGLRLYYGCLWLVAWYRHAD